MLLAQTHAETHGECDDCKHDTNDQKEEHATGEADIALIRRKHAVEAIRNGPARACRPQMHPFLPRGSFLGHLPIGRVEHVALWCMRWLRGFYVCSQACSGSGSGASSSRHGVASRVGEPCTSGIICTNMGVSENKML